MAHSHRVLEVRASPAKLDGPVMSLPAKQVALFADLAGLLGRATDGKPEQAGLGDRAARKFRTVKCDDLGNDAQHACRVPLEEGNELMSHLWGVVGGEALVQLRKFVEQLLATARLNPACEAQVG